MSAAGQPGAERIVRLTPVRVVLRATGGAPVARGTALHRQPTGTRRPLAVALGATGGQPEVRGWGPA